MELLRTQPVSRHIDDGEKAVYECQACLTHSVLIVDPYAVPDFIRCALCDYYEGDEEC